MDDLELRFLPQTFKSRECGLLAGDPNVTVTFKDFLRDVPGNIFDGLLTHCGIFEKRRDGVMAQIVHAQRL